MLQHEAGKLAGVEAMPMDFCVAETQGSIAYLIEMGMRNVMARNDIQRDVVTLVTQVAVNKLDPMFQNPTKPVGPYYTKEQAEEFARQTGAKYKEDPKGNGWRKVVALLTLMALYCFSCFDNNLLFQCCFIDSILSMLFPGDLRTISQFSSVAQLCPTLCDPRNHSTPGLPVHH